MLALWLTALHVTAAITWVAGVILLGVVGAVGDTGASGLRRIGTWNRRVTTPAMLATWALGITLAMRGGWFASPWLMAKLAIVVALAALHGVLSGHLRRRSVSQEANVDGATLVMPLLTVAAVGAIAALVVVRPF